MVNTIENYCTSENACFYKENYHNNYSHNFLHDCHKKYLISSREDKYLDTCAKKNVRGSGKVLWFSGLSCNFLSILEGYVRIT